MCAASRVSPQEISILQHVRDVIGQYVSISRPLNTTLDAAVAETWKKVWDVWRHLGRGEGEGEGEGWRKILGFR